MTENKRADGFAYLRRNILNTESFGLYPQADFVRVEPDGLAATDTILDIIGWKNEQKIIVEGESAFTFYQVGSNSKSNDDYSGSDIVATALGNKETNPLYFVDDVDDKVYSANFTNSTIAEIATFPSTAGVGIGGFDGLYYWWMGDRFWRQLGGGTPELMFSPSGFRSSETKFLGFYNEQMIIYTQQDEDVVIYFWDKKSSTFFNRRITLPKTKLIAGAVIDGLPMLVKSVGVAGNQKEKIGELVVMAYNGSEFVRLNAIRTGQRSLSIPGGGLNGTTCRANSEYMVFSVKDNDLSENTDLYNNYIYRVWRDGRIEALTLPVQNSSVRNYAGAVNIFSQNIVYAVENIGAEPSKVYTQQDWYEENNHYDNFSESQYVTNFLTNSYNRKVLTAVSVSFEKLFRNGSGTGGVEQLDLYCRVSEKDAWTLLGEVTAQKVIDNANLRLDPTLAGTPPMLQQRYQITKLPNGNALPEFNEIQFKFHSKNGFSVIGAWFEYDYLTRVTKR